MIVDLTVEEYQFIRKMVTREVALTEMDDDSFRRLKTKDFITARLLLEKLIKEKK